MKYRLSEEEKDTIRQFKSLRIPSIFKTDDTAFILFVEEVDFTACEMLLKGKEITEKIYNWLVTDTNNGHCPCYEDFVKVVKQFYVDEYTKEYCDKIIQVIEIFKKYKS